MHYRVVRAAFNLEGAPDLRLWVLLDRVSGLRGHSLRHRRSLGFFLARVLVQDVLPAAGPYEHCWLSD